MNSKLYFGHVYHSRVKPKPHAFKYGLFAFFIDLDEIQKITRKVFSIGIHFWNLFRFNRKDYHRNEIADLKAAVQKTVFEKTGLKLTGRVCLLTQLRFMGYTFNPVSFYYCYDETDRLRAILSEIENTPWGERFGYVQVVEDMNARKHTRHFEKEFHVSPFMPMEQNYKWEFNTPTQDLWVSMTSYENESPVFNANLKIRERELNNTNLLKCAVKYPFMPQKVALGIYIQALRLYLKKIPFFDHPNPNSQINFNIFSWRNRNV